MSDDQIRVAESLARQFHSAYERMAPDYGYETRPETREFDPESPNGKLMIAVCREIQAAHARYAGSECPHMVTGEDGTGHCRLAEGTATGESVSVGGGEAAKNLITWRYVATEMHDAIVGQTKAGLIDHERLEQACDTFWYLHENNAGADTPAQPKVPDATEGMIKAGGRVISERCFDGKKFMLACGIAGIVYDTMLASQEGGKG